MSLIRHFPYEEWLLAQDDPQAEELTPEQQQLLRQHLAECAECRRLVDGWQGARESLRHVTLAAPAPGFTERWQTRLAQERQRTHHRQTLALLGFSLFCALLLLACLLLMIAPWLGTPRLLLWTWAGRIIWLLASLVQVGDELLPAMRGLGQAIPLAFWVFAAGMLSLLGVLWLMIVRWAAVVGRVAR